MTDAERADLEHMTKLAVSGAAGWAKSAQRAHDLGLQLEAEKADHDETKLELECLQLAYDRLLSEHNGYARTIYAQRQQLARCVEPVYSNEEGRTVYQTQPWHEGLDGRRF